MEVLRIGIGYVNVSWANPYKIESVKAKTRLKYKLLQNTQVITDKRLTPRHKLFVSWLKKKATVLWTYFDFIRKGYFSRKAI